MTRSASSSFRNWWTTIIVGTVLFIATIAAVIGFVWIPLSQNGGTATTFLDAICSAAGVPALFRSVPIEATTANRPSDLVATSLVIGETDSKSIARGTELAMRCTGCHVAGGANNSLFHGGEGRCIQWTLPWTEGFTVPKSRR